MSVPTSQKSELYDLAKLGYEKMNNMLGNGSPWPFALLDAHVKSAWIETTLAITQAHDVNMKTRA